MISFNYINKYLQTELLLATGCTEPIAVAFTASKCREVFGNETPEKLNVIVSIGILKNASGVTVPNSGGRKGTRDSAVVGFFTGDAKLGLEVLNNTKIEDVKKIEKYFNSDFCTVTTDPTLPKVYVKVEAISKNHKVTVEIKDTHTGLFKITKDEKEIFSLKEESLSEEPIDIADKLNLDLILSFIESEEAKESYYLIERQIDNNMKIAEYGIDKANSTGLNVGKTILKNSKENDYINKAKAYTAAGSDARMAGCPMPVGIVCGSGNQGITASVPLVILYESLSVDRETLLKSILLSDLIALYIKKPMGRLSPFCGAVSAATGVAGAIVYQKKGSTKQIKTAINNMLSGIAGMFCDGAKASCAIKCSSAIEAAFTAANLALDNQSIAGFEGIVSGYDVEKTIKNITEIGATGMLNVDKVICSIMTGDCQD